MTHSNYDFVKKRTNDRVARSIRDGYDLAIGNLLAQFPCHHWESLLEVFLARGLGVFGMRAHTRARACALLRVQDLT